MQRNDLVDIYRVSPNIHEDNIKTRIKVKSWDEEKVEGIIYKDNGTVAGPGFFYWSEIESLSIYAPPIKFCDGDILQFEDQYYVWWNNKLFSLVDYVYHQDTLEDQIRRGVVKFVYRPSQETIKSYPEPADFTINKEGNIRVSKPTSMETGSDGDWCGR